MKFSVRKSDLLSELRLLQGVLERKNTIPILANVLLEANGDGAVHLLATDLEVGLRSRCDAAIDHAGSITLPAKKLYEIVRALPDTDIRIEQGQKGAVKVSADRFDSRMQTFSGEDFPTVPEPGGVSPVVLPRDGVRKMVTRTQFAITGEDTRYFLNGALFVLRSDEMSMIATDGHRLALATSPCESGQSEIRATLPKKTLLELAKLLSTGTGDVRYECGENHLFFEVDGRQLISRKIDGKFPAYERVIPSGHDKRIEFDRDRLTSAIKRVALLTSERSSAVKFQISRDTVEVTSSSPEVGEAKEVLAVDYGGSELTIGFNPQYVLDFLAVVETDSVSLELKDEKSQAVMHPADGASEYTYVIMPMRV